MASPSRTHVLQVLTALSVASIAVSLVLPWGTRSHGGVREDLSAWDGIGDLWTTPLGEILLGPPLPFLALVGGALLLLWGLKGSPWMLRAGSVTLLLSSVLYYLLRYVPLREEFGGEVSLGTGFFAALLASAMGLAAASKTAPRRSST